MVDKNLEDRINKNRDPFSYDYGIWKNILEYSKI